MARGRNLLALAGAGLAAACGGGSEAISVHGDFARGGATSPDRVYAVEAGQGAELKDGAFALDGLATSPISLRLVQTGDTVGRVDIADLPPGSRLVLRSLRTDPRSGRSFPASVELAGAQLVTVNGIRMMNADALPATVDADGVVLAQAADRSALLVRPADEELPDLRVVVTPAAAVVTRDSLAADLGTLSVGDSLRVQGGTERGYVVATRLVLPASAAAPTVSAAEAEPDAPRAAYTAPAAARPAGVPVASARSGPPGRERKEDRGRGGGKGNGKGRGKGKG